MPPGSAVFMGRQTEEAVSIDIFDYDEKNCQESKIDKWKDLKLFLDSKSVTWINVCGLHDVEIIQGIAEDFNLHALTVEDILSTQQRPKIEIFNDYVYVVVKMLHQEGDEIVPEQLSIVVGHGFVFTFQEVTKDIFEPLRNRIRRGTGRIRKLAADYLAYALMDIVVDNYFTILENIGDELEETEEEVLGNPDEEILQRIYYLRRKLIFMRKSTWPLREVVSQLQRGEIPLIKKATTPFISDLYDHTIQVIDSVETYREMVNGILDVYLTSVSNRMNEIMKVLTIIATIFIPLSFLAGVYGMNFDTASPYNMPELQSRYGYLIFWGITLTTFGGLLVFFRSKKWL